MTWLERRDDRKLDERLASMDKEIKDVDKNVAELKGSMEMLLSLIRAHGHGDGFPILRTHLYLNEQLPAFSYNTESINLSSIYLHILRSLVDTP